MKTEVSKIKWGAITKTDRNKLLREYASQHPDFTLKEIGSIFSITPQRVFQILAKANNHGKPNPLSLKGEGEIERKMPLDKALEILRELPDNLNNVLDYDQQDALKLGIEALKRCQFLNEHSPLWKAKPLPGEAEE